MKIRSKESALFWGLCMMILGLSSASCSNNEGESKMHEIEQLNGKAPRIKLEAYVQVITEGWDMDRWTAIDPYLVYMPEKDRLLLLITRRDFTAGDLNPWGRNRPMLLHSDNHGDTWSQPRPLDAGSNEVEGESYSLSYLGDGKVVFLCPQTEAWWISRDYGERWERLSAARGYAWNPPFVDADPSTGKVRRLIDSFSLPSGGGAYMRVSLDEGQTWGEDIKVPQWRGFGELAFARAANGDVVAAGRSESPKRFHGLNDGYGGMGVSISKDDGRTWSDFNMLYDWGRHHSSMVRLSTGELVMSYLVRRGYPDTPDGQFHQFGEEAVVSFDNGQTWDLDHRYILYKYHGSINRRENSAGEGDPQNTSSVVLPNDEIVTVFGIGPRTGNSAYEVHHYYPRDIGLVRWRINRRGLNQERTISDAPYDSDLRNKFDINPPSQPTAGRTNLVMAKFGAEISASKCLAAADFLLYDPYLFSDLVAFFTSPAWVEVRWPDVHKLDEIIIEGRGLGSLQPPGAGAIQDGYKLQFYQNGQWRDFTNFSETTKVSAWLPGNSLCRLCSTGRVQEFKYVHRFKPVLAEGVRLQWTFLNLDTTTEKRPYISQLEIMGW